MAKTVNADPNEVRKVAESLKTDCQVMLEQTSAMTEAWLAFTAYKGPDSKIIGERCKAILADIKKLTPQVKDAATLLKKYADWLES